MSLAAASELVEARRDRIELSIGAGDLAQRAPGRAEQTGDVGRVAGGVVGVAEHGVMGRLGGDPQRVDMSQPAASVASSTSSPGAGRRRDLVQPARQHLGLEPQFPGPGCCVGQSLGGFAPGGERG